MSLEAMKNIPDEDENLVPATDEEIAQAIKEVLDEAEKEWEEEGLFDENWTDEELAFMEEFGKATTIEERTAVMDKYHLDYQI